MNKRAATLARVSTDTQASTGYSIATQQEAMRAYCEREGLQIIAELKDEISGTVPIRNRPGGAELYRLIDSRVIDAVVFYTVDRVTRDEDLIELGQLRRDVRQAGIELHYAADGGRSDLSTLGGLMDTMKAALAAAEREKIIERSMRGRRGKAASGRWVGQGDPPFGYRRIGSRKETRLEIDETEAGVVRRIFELYVGAGGRKPMSIREMTAFLTEQRVTTPQRGNRMGRHGGTAWHTRSIQMILERQLYIGLMPYPGLDQPVQMPSLRIISDELFEAAQAQRKRNRERSLRHRKYDYLLAQHLRCPCGRAMIGYQKSNGRYRYYMCAGRSLPRHLQTCHEDTVSADSLEPLVWGWVTGLLTEPETLRTALEDVANRSAEALAPLRSRLAALDGEMDRYERRIRVWVGQYGDASDVELAELKAQVRRASDQMAALREERARLKADIDQATVSPQQFADIEAQARELREYLPSADYDAKRYVLDRLDVQGRLRRNEAGELVCEVSADALGPDFPIVSTALQISLPATPGRCCDSRPAPRTPGGRSG